MHRLHIRRNWIFSRQELGKTIHVKLAHSSGNYIILGNGVSSPRLQIVLDLSTLKLMKMVLVIHGKL